MKKAQRKIKPPTPKRRKNRQRAKRLANEELRNALSTERKRLRTDAPITALRLAKNEEIVIGVRKGTFGHPGTVLLRVDDVAIAGMVEDKGELAKFINNVGLLAVAQLFRYNLAEGLDGLGKSIAKWAGIDVEALKKAAEDEAAATPAAPVVIDVPSVDDVTNTNETTPVL